MAVASLQELIAQKEALEREIEKTRNKNRDDAITKVRALMDEYGLTVADLSVRRSPKLRNGKGNKVAPKFRDASTGDTWSGRGLQPKWLKAALASGRKLSEFTI
jgi:DNA-binding protein H-NS